MYQEQGDYNLKSLRDQTVYTWIVAAEPRQRLKSPKHDPFLKSWKADLCMIFIILGKFSTHLYILTLKITNLESIFTIFAKVQHPYL